MSLEDVTEKIRQKFQYADRINARILFDFDEEGKIFVDATQSPPAMTNEESDADVTLISSLDTFEKILDGAQDPNIAFMLGKLKIRGSMGLAMKLNSVLES
jgi:putative sterol carrier protein